MPRYPETRVLLEQALRHVLSEQEKLLKRDDRAELTPILTPLSQLAIKTSNLLAEGFNRVKVTSHLTNDARKIEKTIDDLSETLWTFIPVSVSAIYERVEKSLTRKEGKRGFVADARAYYHNLRLRLLEQTLGARMLVLNSDLGDESERIWQQFLEQHLGPTFRVLRGGHICDHDGRTSCQIDLIVVAAGAQVFVPGDSDGGKAQVLIDQVISAIMVTSNLTADKLKDDWKKLQSIPVYTQLEKDFGFFKGHPWPLCFFLAAQSEPGEKLKEAWCDLCHQGFIKVIPQFIISLDTGFLYSGATKWPKPRFPSNYIEADHVSVESGIYSGLGLAWLIIQHQGRLAAIRKEALGPVSRFAHLLDEAMVREEGVPPTYSPRFDSMFRQQKIAEIFEWGGVSCHAHNRLPLNCLGKIVEGTTNIFDTYMFRDGTDVEALRSATNFFGYTNHLRWFRYPATIVGGEFLAIEEWIEPTSKTEHRQRIAIFNVITGEEITGSKVESLITLPNSAALAEFRNEEV